MWIKYLNIYYFIYFAESDSVGYGFMQKKINIGTLILIAVIFVALIYIAYSELFSLGYPGAPPPYPSCINLLPQDYLCINNTAHLTMDGKLSFIFEQNTGSTLHNVSLSCSNSSTPSTFINLGANLLSNIRINVSHLQCYNYGGAPMQNLSIGQTLSPNIFLKLGNMSAFRVFRVGARVV